MNENLKHTRDAVTANDSNNFTSIFLQIKLDNHFIPSQLGAMWSTQVEGAVRATACANILRYRIVEPFKPLEGGGTRLCTAQELQSCQSAGKHPASLFRSAPDESIQVVGPCNAPKTLPWRTGHCGAPFFFKKVAQKLNLGKKLNEVHITGAVVERASEWHRPRQRVDMKLLAVSCGDSGDGYPSTTFTTPMWVRALATEVIRTGRSSLLLK